MKRYLSLGLVVLSYLVLISCSFNSRSPALSMDLTRETWIHEVDTQQNKWLRGADRWFLTGDPNAIERDLYNSPYADIVATTKVRVSNFSNIRVNGDFEVQVFGTYGNNSAYLYGPNDAIRQLSVELKGETLCIGQNKKVTKSVRNVIVRIGVSQLNSIVQLGRGTIEGTQLRSNHLFVLSQGSGHIYLAGNMNVKQIVNAGSGCITILGANTPMLDIKTSGTGTTNVCGNVGIRTIMHRGKGDVNIIGANSNDLRIYANGKGKIGIKGIVDLKEVRIRDYVRAYVYNLASSSSYVYVYGNARLGLAGTANQIYLDAFKNACVGARNLCVRTIYVRAHDNAHINIGTNHKIFAAATENGSIYIFGSPNIMSQFVSGHGAVIPIWASTSPYCPMIKPVQAIVLPPKPRAVPRTVRAPVVFPYPKFKPDHFRGEG